MLLKMMHAVPGLGKMITLL